MSSNNPPKVIDVVTNAGSNVGYSFDSELSCSNSDTQKGCIVSVAPPYNKLTLNIPPGRIGVFVQVITHKSGLACKVMQKDDDKSLLEVGNVIEEIDGIPFNKDSWANLISSLDNKTKTIIVVQWPIAMTSTVHWTCSRLELDEAIAISAKLKSLQ